MFPNQVKKAPMLVTDPDIPRSVSGNGSYRVGQSAYGKETAIVEVGDTARCGDPHSSAIVLKEGLHIVIRQPRYACDKP